ncbi:MAG TPA: hypothetical protein PKO06_06365 [Candidatus Ozemobacteraceae bacterium]|nr:hypothetical protein [Candidatus Ozemobacteraceae bacterium]
MNRHHEREMHPWRYALEDTGYPLAERILDLRLNRERWSEKGAWQLVPISVFDGLLRSAMQRISPELRLLLFQRLTEGNCPWEALAIARIEQDPRTRIQLLKGLQTRTPARIGKVLSRELDRLQQLYPALFAKTTPWSFAESPAPDAATEHPTRAPSLGNRRECSECSFLAAGSQPDSSRAECPQRAQQSPAGDSARTAREPFPEKASPIALLECPRSASVH